MKRVLVLGCCGSGKTTFSQALSQITNIPVIHLDKEYFSPNWVETPKEEWHQKVSTLSNRKAWIMDGNYSGSLNLRIPLADTIYYLDNSTRSSLYRITKRIIDHHGKVRPHMAPGCKERFDLEFFHYVAVFNWIKRPGIMKRLMAPDVKEKAHILKNDRERDQELKRLTALFTSY